MNNWTKLSIDYANQISYLDDLFHVYPTIPDGIRDINQIAWSKIENSFNERNNHDLINELLKLDLFPIKDSYITYLKRDKSSIERNPRTINRICGRLYDMGLNDIFQKCSEPKETNRQIGPMFRNWIKQKSLGIMPVGIEEFISSSEDAILDSNDNAMKQFAKEHLGYTNSKGLDFVARFNNKYAIGEAKFLTDFGGHQNAQFNDAMTLIKTKNVNAVKIAILDGVLYIKGQNKLYKSISENSNKEIVLSALVLREFLYSL
jgi:hypothetical protein